jgi:hypothetical protein
VLGVLSASFSPLAGFGAGTIGSGPVDSAAIAVDRGRCEKLSAERPREIKTQRLEGEGQITGLATASVTIKLVGRGAVTCEIGAKEADALEAQSVGVGSHVRIVCELASDRDWHLAGVKSLGRDDDEGKHERSSHREAFGRVDALSDTSVTVGSLTCTCSRDVAADLDVGEKVQALCERSSDGFRLVKIRRAEAKHS